MLRQRMACSEPTCSRRLRPLSIADIKCFTPVGMGQALPLAKAWRRSWPIADSPEFRSDLLATVNLKLKPLLMGIPLDYLSAPAPASPFLEDRLEQPHGFLPRLCD